MQEEWKWNHIDEQILTVFILVAVHEVHWNIQYIMYDKAPDCIIRYSK